MNVQAPEGSGGSTGPAELAQPSGLKWTDATASWNAVTGAESYTVKLYKNTDTLVDTYTNIAGTSRDFKAVITETGDYSFTVQAIAPSGSTDYTDGRESAGSAAYSFVKKDDQGFILISTPDELLALAEAAADLTKNYKLANDLDMDCLLYTSWMRCVTKERPRKNWDAINSWNARGNGAKNLAEGLHGS